MAVLKFRDPPLLLSNILFPLHSPAPELQNKQKQALVSRPTLVSHWWQPFFFWFPAQKGTVNFQSAGGKICVSLCKHLAHPSVKSHSAATVHQWISYGRPWSGSSFLEKKKKKERDFKTKHPPPQIINQLFPAPDNLPASKAGLFFPGCFSFPSRGSLTPEGVQKDHSIHHSYSVQLLSQTTPSQLSYNPALPFGKTQK